MWQGTSDRLLTAIRQSHTVYSYAEVWRAGVKQGEVPLVGGTVDVDEDAQVRRTLNLETSDIGLDPEVATDLLSPFGAELRVFSGVQFPEGDVETVPMGVFSVDRAGRSRWFGRVAVQASDRTRAAIEFPFITPRNVTAGVFVLDEIQAILTEVDPTFVLSDFTNSDELTKSAIFERDRWPAVESLASAIGAEVYFDQTGVPTVRGVPELEDEPAWTIQAGAEGVLVDVETALTREGFYNGVVCFSEPQGDEQPVTAVAYQLTGDLRWGGPAGKKLRFYSSPFIQTTDQARSAAGAILKRSVAFARSVSPTVIRNPALDVGDTVWIELPDGLTYPRVVKRLSVPLGIGTMTVETRVATDPGYADDLGSI
jgi:hypothetical protein